MRTAYRVLSAAVAAGAIFPFGMPAASASTTVEVPVEVSAWFWKDQVSGSGPGGVPLQPIPRDAAGVPKGDLAVAYKGETETDEDGTKRSVPDKETYLQWDVYAVPEGSTVESFTFTMFLDPEAEQLYGPGVAVPSHGTRGGPPAIVACAATIGFGEADGDAFTAKPDDNCVDQVFGEFDEKTMSYTFHAAPYAQDWVDGKDNFGLGIRPMEDAADPFQLHFLPATKIKTTMTYTPPAAEPTVPPATFEPIPLPPLPPTDTSGYVPVAPEPQPQPQPQPQPSPVVEQPKQVVVTNVAATPLRASRALSPLFWFATAAGVLLLGVTSLILGDPIEPAAAGTSRVRTGGRHLAPAPARATRPIRARTV